MPPEPVPADPGWDEDLAWLDRDPERESWLDRAREHDEPPGSGYGTWRLRIPGPGPG